MRSCSDANEMYCAMRADIAQSNFSRLTDDSASPTRSLTVEATLGQTYCLANPESNLVTCRPVDFRWARANVLHFFTGSDAAGVLRKYNRHADKFLTGNIWDGAYGAIALPKIRRCVEILRESPHSRRAIVDMGDVRSGMSINRPACWSCLHFLRQMDRLHLIVYQRSLALSVMPYDCTCLANILLYAAIGARAAPGSLLWTVGSLHCIGELPELVSPIPATSSMVLPYALLADSEACRLALEMEA